MPPPLSSTRPGPRPPPAAARPTPTTGSAPTASVSPAPSPSGTPAGCTASASAEPTPEPTSCSWSRTSTSASSTPRPASSSATSRSTRTASTSPPDDHQDPRPAPHARPANRKTPNPNVGSRSFLCPETSQERWRWDLNPRKGCPFTRFRGVRPRPLGDSTAAEPTRRARPSGPAPGEELLQQGPALLRRYPPHLPGAVVARTVAQQPPGRARRTRDGVGRTVDEPR